MTRFHLKFAMLAVVVSPLLGGADDCASSHERRDAGPGGDGDGDGDGELDGGSVEACAPSDCAGQPIPEIGCAEGQPIVLCERRADGSCHVRVDCPGKVCGGFAGVGCDDGQFCNYETTLGGDGCDGVADGQGVCQPIPEGCTREYAPVCGCDRRGYGNACTAHMAGVSVLHEGQCTVEECESIGGRVEASDGASIPACQPGEEQYDLPGIEPVLCCLPGSGSGLRWFSTCGDPVCGGHRPSELRPCTSESQGMACDSAGDECDVGDDCNTHMICASSDPTQGPGGCPISRAAAKTNIRYLDDAELVRYHDEVLALGIAQYSYAADPAREPRLGFIIEDVEPSAFVEEAKSRVDLYAYTSALVAALQVQDKRIRQLEAQVAQLSKQKRFNR